MSTAAVATEQPVTTQTTTTVQPESLGWRAGLPDDLKQSPDLASYKTVGDFTKDALGWKGKATKLETEKANYIPKLPENPGADDLNAYYDALGRPKQASEYEFDGEDKTDPNWTNAWKDEFHKNGITKEQAKNITAAFNKRGQEYMAFKKAKDDAELATAEKTFRTEMGDKYDTNVELAKRVTKQHLGEEFDSAFAEATPLVRLNTTRIILKLAALTGEDVSPSGTIGERGAAKKGSFEYPNSPQMKDMGRR